ncbi:MAG: hypothetical protein U1F65_07275 [Verrucomicrobiota bacterium]
MNPSADVSRRASLTLLLGMLSFLPANSKADLNNLPPGYSIKIVSSNVNATAISQFAFKPGDMTHVYAARDSQAQVTRYDYNPVTGVLSNALMVATNTDHKELIGLGFHGPNLYVTFDYGGSQNSGAGTGDGRLARYFNPNSNGVYQSRHDFVYGLDKGDHDLNLIKIKGDSLYVGIGAAARNGNPARDNFYTMTVARIVNLNQIVSDTNQIGANFKGPVNYLAATNEWINTNGADGQLRYFASGFRNPFGINFDPDGDLWVSSNGNNDVGYSSEDLLYKKVHLGDQGDFPPPAFGFSTYIHGNPIAPFIDFGISPAVAGFDFIREGVDAGKVLLVEAGATKTNWLGRDLVLIDPNTGSHQQIYQFATNTPLPTMTDCLRDPYGRFLIADYVRGNVWLLTPPLPQPGLTGSVSNGILHLSWPLTGVEYQLEETTNLAAANSWQASGVAAQIGGSSIDAHIIATNAMRFYRLRR